MGGEPLSAGSPPIRTLSHVKVYSAPHSAEWSIKVFRSLRRATKGSAFGNRKPLKRLERNFNNGFNNAIS